MSIKDLKKETNWKYYLFRTKVGRISEFKKFFIAFFGLVAVFSVISALIYSYSSFRAYTDLLSVTADIILASVGVLSLYIGLKKFVYQKNHSLRAECSYEVQNESQLTGEIDKVEVSIYNYGRSPIFVNFYSFLVIERAGGSYEEDFIIRQKLFDVKEIIKNGESKTYSFNPESIGLRTLDVTYSDSQDRPHNMSMLGGGHMFQEKAHPTLKKLFNYSYRYYENNKSDLLPEHDEGFVMGIGANKEELEEKSAKEIWLESGNEGLNFEELKKKSRLL